MGHGCEYIYMSTFCLSFSVKILGIATFFSFNSSGFPLTTNSLHSTSLKAMSITFVGTDWIAGILPKNKF